MGFGAVPCFCLQLLLCRAARRPLLRLIPALLLTGAAALSVTLCLTSAGLDSLTCILIFCLCIAPALGCALGWGVYGIRTAIRKIGRNK